MGELAEFLRSTELFTSVDPGALEALLPDTSETELSAGEVLLSQGDLSQNLYFLLSGRLRVAGRDGQNQPRLLLEVHPGESVGEMALLSDDPAPATIQAATNSRILVLPRTTFDGFSAKHPQAALQVTEAVSRRLQRYRLLVALQLSNLFDTLEPNVLRDLESELEMFTLYGGEILFRQGDTGDFLCVVISGRVRVSTREPNGVEVTVAELGPGELVGEMAVVRDKPRTATVEAMRDTQLARLSKAGFNQFLGKHPQAAVETVTRQLADRLSATTASLGTAWVRSVSTLAIVPAHGGAPISEVCEALVRALTVFGSTVHLTSGGIDAHLGKEGIAQTYERGGSNIRMVEWLSSQELVHDYVLYEADASLSPWTERCVRQADHVLIVADAKADPALGDIEAELLAPPRAQYAGRQSLVMVHGPDAPSGTGKWLDVRDVERHYHVRLSESEGFQRMARFLTGRAVGLTLGGGFARGLAHVGVFEAFHDLDIRIDAIGGASMGAMVGALHAMGWPGEKIVSETRAGCEKAFNDLTFPFLAFKTGKRFSEVVRSFFRDVCIEDLWIPYFCISANLNRSELRIHKRGSLAKAVLAATRAPGVFPPVIYDSDLHIDGGVINNVPVDIMKPFLNNGITVGVDVSPPHELHPVADYGDEVSGWQAFWKRLNPFTKNHVFTPSILLVMIRTLEFSGISYKNLRLKFADIYMYPDLIKFKRTDFHLASGIAKAGYDCARAKLLEWLADTETVAARRPDLAHGNRDQEQSVSNSTPAASEAV